MTSASSRATILGLTQERINLNEEVSGNKGLRSGFTRKGSDLVSDPLIDPGFERHLYLVLINLNPSQKIIEFGERFTAVGFREVTEPVEDPYDGEYQTEDRITSDEIRDFHEGEGIALSEAVKAIQTIAHDVNGLQEIVDQISQTVSENSENANQQMEVFVREILGLVGVVISSLSIIVFEVTL